MTPVLRLALLSTLTLPLSAQDSPLVVQTSSPEVAMGLAVSLGSLDPLPDLMVGRHYVLALGEGGIDVTTEAGDAGLLKIVARPEPLMGRFSDRIAQAQGMIQGSMMMSLSQQGLQPADVAAMAQAVIDFPKQVETLNLEVTGDPASIQQGLSAELGLTPKQGSWFAGLVDAVTQVSSGAPALPGTGFIQMTMGVELESYESLTPILELLSTIGAGSEEEKAKRQDMMRKAYTNATGTASMSWNLAGGGMQVISGLRDPEAAEELLSDPSYQELTTSFGAGGFEMDYEPNALEHRGVKIHKMSMDLGISNPLVPAGAMESYYAVAGDYSLTTTYAPSADGIKALIDSVLDRELKLAPMPGDTLGTMSLDFAGLMNMMGAGVPMGDGPERLDVELAKSDGQLVIRLDMR